MKWTQGALLFLAVCFYLIAAQDIPEIPDTVPELDTTKYIGRWYQMYASALVYARTQRGAVCVTADYGVFNATTLTVYNANRNVTPDGALLDIRGYAYKTDEPGKFWLNLIGGSGFAPYWVLKLGPPVYGETGQYGYTIVSGPTRRVLFVLGRNPQDFRQNYQQEVLSWLENNGFDDPLNEPIATYQGEDCQYAQKPTYTEYDWEEY